MRHLEAGRDASRELLEDRCQLASDDGVDGTGHAEVGDVGRAFGQDLRVVGRNVRVGAGHSGDASIEVAAQCYFLRGGLGVDFHKDWAVVRGKLLENRVASQEGAVRRLHEDASKDGNHGNRAEWRLHCDIADAGVGGRKVRGAYDTVFMGQELMKELLLI